jgi:hypothetical protein
MEKNKRKGHETYLTQMEDFSIKKANIEKTLSWRKKSRWDISL